MSDSDKQFSFDNDPGKLTDKSDVEFTFSDIPVLGVSKDKKDSFSFDQLPGEDAAIASFDEMLRDGADSGSGESTDATPGSEVENALTARKAKNKKKLLIKIAIGACALVLVLAGIGVTLLLVAQARARAEEEAKKLTPEQLRALEVKRQRDRISALIGEADSAYYSDRRDVAEEKYGEVLRLEPENTSAVTGIALCLLNKGEKEEAESRFSQAMDMPGADHRPYENLALLSIERGDNEKAIELLETAQQKFPDESAILIPLADSYYRAGNRVKALNTYKKVSQTVMPESSLRCFAELMKLESKEDAKKIYMYIANKFGGLFAYSEAAALTDDPKDKILILSDAVASLKDEPDAIHNARLLLAKAYLESGDKSKAASELNGISVPKLDPEYRASIISVAIAAGVDNKTDFLQGILKNAPNDIQLQKDIQEQAILQVDPEVVLSVYSDWWSSNRENALANYLFAKSLGFSPSAKNFYEAALAIQPDMYDARFELGKIAMNEKNWSEASKAFMECLKSMSENKEALYNYTLCAIKSGGGKQSIDEYRKHLEKLGHDNYRISAELVDLALLLDTPELADHFLKVMSEDNRLKQQHRIFSAKRQLLFGGPAGDAFSHSPKTGLYREYCIIDMLSRGEEREVLMMPTPAEEFPEFWKVFISRRRNIKGWEKSAELLLEKNKHAADQTFRIIASLWLGLSTPDDVEKMFNRIPFDKEALVYMMLAEEYRRLNQLPSAKIRFRKAQSSGRNVYSGVIDFFGRQIP